MSTITFPSSNPVRSLARGLASLTINPAPRLRELRIELERQENTKIQQLNRSYLALKESADTTKR